MRGENQAGPLFTIVNCVDAWMIALELDHSELITLEDDIVFYYYNFDLVYLKNTY